jgi:ribonuclease J
VRARIHRGAQEIGGNCVELEAGGKRLVLDIGRPLWAEASDPVPLPSVAGLDTGTDHSLLGVVISHAHPDHYGLAGLLPNAVPLFTGAATARILRESQFFTPMGLDREPAELLADRQPLVVGPFTITPFLVDHSAFDAYALLVEADGRRLFYTGDFRAHGRKAELIKRLLREPPVGVDVLLIEGTRLGRAASSQDPTDEADVERQCVEIFPRAEGIVLVAFSMQNVDRMVSLYRAALRADRDLILDLYGAAVTLATGSPNIPQPGADRVRFFVPQAQRVKILRSRQFERVHLIHRDRIYPEQLSQEAARLVLSFRPSMIPDLERAKCLHGAEAIWSMWPGYVQDERMIDFREFLDRHQIPLTVLHASGHATVEDLVRLAEAMKPKRIVPIHTAHPERFASIFGHAEPHRDLEWWGV